MEADGSNPGPVGVPTGASAPEAVRGARVVAVASARLVLGSALLAGTGVTRLLAIAAEAGAPTPPPGAYAPAPRARTVPGPIVSVSREVAGTIGRAVGTAVGATPAVVRQPVGDRLASWRVSAAAEEERSRLVAAATIETAVGFMTDWIVERLDVNRIVERLRLDDIIADLELTDVIVSSTGGVTGHVLDNARSRAVGADAFVDRALAHLHIRPDGRRGRLGPAGEGDAAPTTST